MSLPPLRELLRRRAVVVLLVVVAVLLAVRVALPHVVVSQVNRALSDMPGVQGSIETVDLYLLRGAYVVHGLELRRIQQQEKEETAFVSVPTMRFSIGWRALLRGMLVSEIEIHRPYVVMIVEPPDPEEPGMEELVQRFQEMMPLRIDRLVLIDAELHFRELGRPQADIYLDRVQVLARNLTNSERLSDTLSATVNADGRAMTSGAFTLAMKLNPLAKQPTYQLAFDLKELWLPELNEFLRHYLSVVAHDGWFSMYAESSAAQGRFEGYVTPIVRDLDVLTIEPDKTVPERVKGFFVRIFAHVFKHRPKDQLAAKVEFSGTFDDPDVGTLQAVGSFLRNAFVRALEPGLEGTVAPEQVENDRPRQRPGAGDGR
jgi:hypothetical protein